MKVWQTSTWKTIWQSRKPSLLRFRIKLKCIWCVVVLIKNYINFNVNFKLTNLLFIDNIQIEIHAQKCLGKKIQYYCLPFANERLDFKNVIEFQYVWDILLFLLEKLTKNGLQWKAKCLIFHMKAHLLLQLWSFKTWLKTDLV